MFPGEVGAGVGGCGPWAATHQAGKRACGVPGALLPGPDTQPPHLLLPLYLSSVCPLQSLAQRLTTSEMGGFLLESRFREGQGLACRNTASRGRWESPAFPTVPGRNPLSASPPLPPSGHFLGMLLPPPPVTSFSTPHFVAQLIL